MCQSLLLSREVVETAEVSMRSDSLVIIDSFRSKNQPYADLSGEFGRSDPLISAEGYLDALMPNMPIVPDK